MEKTHQYNVNQGRRNIQVTPFSRFKQTHIIISVTHSVQTSETYLAVGPVTTDSSRSGNTTLISRSSKRWSAPKSSARLPVSVGAVTSDMASLARRVCALPVRDSAAAVFAAGNIDALLAGGGASLSLSLLVSASSVSSTAFHLRVALSSPSPGASVRARGAERCCADSRDETSSGTSSSLRYTSMRLIETRVYRSTHSD